MNDRTRLFPVVALLAAVASLVVLLVPVVRATPQATSPAADVVVAEAVARARATGKTVLIEFGASWCIWCRSFEAFVHAPDSGPIVAAHYVATNLVVRERDEKQALEHAGGDRLMRQWGGEQAGLPFYVFLDRDGRKVADSNAMADGSNIGFPATPVEIAAFMGLIDKTARGLSKSDRAVLQTSLTRRMPPATPAPR